MQNLFLRQTSSLEKVFLQDKESDKKELNSSSALLGERFSYQVIHHFTHDDKTESRISAVVSVDSPLKDYTKLYNVENVASELPAYPEYNDDYITTTPGLFPDILMPMEDGKIYTANHLRSIWVIVDVPKDLKEGSYPITITMETEENKESLTFTLKVIGARLPKQETIFTQWFHSDGISNYFNAEVFSERFWNIVENYVKTASECGINMLLTPIFTPPLDTSVGGERKTVQLVDVYLNNGEYSFNFDKLVRWVKMCKRNNIKYFEMAHLFTQWGAEFTPKIMAKVDGVKKRIFGWDVSATSTEYGEFINSFLPALIKVIDELGIREVTSFHVSDEPNERHLEKYTAAKSLIAKHLEGFKIIDALSDFDFYRRGVVENPVVSLHHLNKFIENGVENLWTYTCCQPATIYSNRFMAMPSGRNRVIGAQMYKYSIKGFLHWGYNFYNTQYSTSYIDPYKTTDAGAVFPSGDSFSVYPYKDGAIHSIRSRVFYEALQDMRAFKLLESFIGKYKVDALIEKYGIKNLEEYSYKDLISLREEVNLAIEKHLK